MNAFSFQTMPAPETGLSTNFFIGRAAPVLTVVPKPAGPPISQVIKEVIAAKIASNRRPAYTRHLKIFLNKFARGRESKPINEFDLTTLEDWFAFRKGKPASAKGEWGRLSTMFTYAKRKKYITGDNPCSEMDKIKIDAKPPRLFTPKEAETLLRHLSGHARRRLRLAQCVIGLFCGIRPTELTRIYWRDIDLDRAVIRVDAAASKVRRRRIVPIPQIAIEWLKLCPMNDNPIGAIRWKWIGDVERGTGLKWDNDILRHCAASYLLAKHEDCGRVARWLGNSADILLKHYTELVSKEDCAAYWNIRPSMEPQDNLFTRAERGQTNGIARSTMNKIKFILKRADEDLLRRVRAGWTCVSDAWDECSTAAAWEPDATEMRP